MAHQDLRQRIKASERPMTLSSCDEMCQLSASQRLMDANAMRARKPPAVRDANSAGFHLKRPSHCYHQVLRPRLLSKEIHTQRRPHDLTHQKGKMWHLLIRGTQQCNQVDACNESKIIGARRRQNVASMQANARRKVLKKVAQVFHRSELDLV